MRGKKTLHILAAMAVLAAGACGGKKDSPSGQAAGKPPVAVETAAVTPADLTDGLEVVGTLSPRFQAEVKAEITGAVAEVYVTEWARVRKGDPLARIDTSEGDVQLRKARAGVEAAQAAGETARANGETARANGQTARAAGDTARAGLSEAQVGVERAQREYDRLLKLKESGLATQQAIDEGLTMRDAARARFRSVEAQVAAAEAQVKSAEAQVKVAEAQVKAAEAQVNVAREDVRGIETRLAKAVVKAPFDGAVAERLVSPGEVVGDMQKIIFRLVDNRLLDLTVTVPSGEMGKVSAGLPLTFSVDTYPGRTFSGTVRRINPAVDSADRSVRVTAEVQNDPEVLKGGLFVKGFIETGRRTGVLRIPRTALVNWDVEGKKGEVFTVEGGTAGRRAVTTGLVKGDLAELTGGLSAGDAVVVRGGFNLKDGDAVKAVTAAPGV
jgi:membrane fusion protein (multidrug efflux system)